MIACALVAQGAVDRDVIGRRSGLCELSGRRDADQQAAAAAKELLGNQHRIGGADRVADRTDPLPVLLPLDQPRMVAGPVPYRDGTALGLDVANQIAVWVKNADRRDQGGVQALLTARFAQQALRAEHRWRPPIPCFGDGRHAGGARGSGWRHIRAPRRSAKAVRSRVARMWVLALSVLSSDTATTE